MNDLPIDAGLAAAHCYYYIVAACVLFYVFVLYAAKLPVFTFTTLNYATATVLGGVYGYSTCTGQELRPELQRGFDQTLYLLFLSFQILMTLGALLGQLMSRKLCLKVLAHTGFKTRVYALAAFVAIYSVAYFIWLKNIPLFELIFGRMSSLDAAALRIKITLQQGTDSEPLPFVFRYWRPIVQYWSVIIAFIVVISRRLKWMYFPNYFVVSWVLFTAFCLTFTLEKAGIIEFAVGLLLSEQFIRRKRIISKDSLAAAATAVVLSAVLVRFFLNYDADVWSVLERRLSVQTSSEYLQIEAVYNRGYLGLGSLPVPFSRLFFTSDHDLPLSTQAYARMFPEQAKEGIVGSAGGLSVVELFIAMGWYALPVFLAFIFIYSAIDALARQTFLQHKNSFGVRVCFAGWYVFFSTMFSMVFLGSVLQILAIPFGLSAQGMAILAPFPFFIRFASLRLARTS